MSVNVPDVYLAQHNVTVGEFIRYREAEDRQWGIVGIDPEDQTIRLEARGKTDSIDSMDAIRYTDKPNPKLLMRTLMPLSHYFDGALPKVVQGLSAANLNRLASYRQLFPESLGFVGFGQCRSKNTG